MVDIVNPWHLYYTCRKLFQASTVMKMSAKFKLQTGLEHSNALLQYTNSIPQLYIYVSN